MTAPVSQLRQKILVADRRQLKVLGSPVRQVILDALIARSEPASIRDIAVRVNRPADSLYYHFRALEKCGLILDAGSKLEHGKAVGLYLPIAREIRIKYELDKPGFRQTICQIAAAAMRLASRDFQRGAEMSQARSRSSQRNLYMCRLEAWLTKPQLRELNRHIDAIVDLMNENCASGVGDRCSVFLSLAPQEKRIDT